MHWKHNFLQVLTSTLIIAIILKVYIKVYICKSSSKITQVYLRHFTHNKTWYWGVLSPERLSHVASGTNIDFQLESC